MGGITKDHANTVMQPQTVNPYAGAPDMSP